MSDEPHWCRVAGYFLLFLIVLGIHLAPAFTPPTWPVIVFYSVQAELSLPLVALAGASAAAAGRHSLALVFRQFGHRLPSKTRRNLDAARDALERRRRGRRLMLLALFTFTPIPSAQLFEAAGIARLRLLPLTAAYFVGRLGFYSAYALAGRQVRATGIGDSFGEHVTSPFAIAVQLLVIAGLVLLIRADWAKWLGSGRGADEGEPR